ncbi:hypothetical protein ACXIUS_26955 [Bosea thiooxidans]
MNFDFIAGFVAGGAAAFFAPLVTAWWDRWMSDDADPLDDPKNWH